MPYHFGFPPQYPIMRMLRTRPQAVADIHGSAEYPAVSGTVRFYQSPDGILVYAEIRGLPEAQTVCKDRVFGFHIHEGTACSGNASDPFADALTHYNPLSCEHPYHAGDLPPLFGNNGLALSICLTNRFSIHEIIGKAVIIHDHPDDFTTQPSGNSGTKIACGIIRKT